MVDVRPFFLGRWLPRASQRRRAGIEVSESAVKFVELEPQGATVRVAKSIIRERPTGVTADDDHWLEETLRLLPLREIGVAISGPEVAVRRLVLPAMPLHELNEAVKWELKDHLPFPAEGAVFDVSVVGQIWDRDVKQLDVLAAAVSGDAFSRWTALFARCGISATALAPSACSIVGAFQRLLPATGADAILEIEPLSTRVLIARDGHLRVVRELPFGSAKIADALVGVVGSEHGEITIDSSMAKALLATHGIVTVDSADHTAEGIPLFTLASLMRPVLESLLTEIGRCLDFYRVQIDSAGVARLRLCGSGAGLRGVQDWLSESLGLPVEPAMPVAGTTDGSRLNGAIGAALGATDVSWLGQPRQGRGADAIRLASRPAWLGFAGILVAVGCVIQGAAWHHGTDVRRAQEEWRRVESQYLEYRKLAREEKQLAAFGRVGRDAKESQPVWTGLLKELGAVLPEGARLDRLEVERLGEGPQAKWALHLHGSAEGAAAGTDSALITLLERLEESVFLHKVQLVRSAVGGDAGGALSFEVSCLIESSTRPQP